MINKIFEATAKYVNPKDRVLELLLSVRHGLGHYIALIIYCYKGTIIYIKIQRPYLWKVYEKELIIPMIIIIIQYMKLIIMFIVIKLLNIWDKKLLLNNLGAIRKRQDAIGKRIATEYKFISIKLLLKEYHLKNRQNRVFDKNYLAIGIRAAYSIAYIYKLILIVVKDLITNIMVKLYIVLLFLSLFYHQKIQMILLPALSKGGYEIYNQTLYIVLLEKLIIVIIIIIIVTAYSNTLKTELYDNIVQEKFNEKANEKFYKNFLRRNGKSGMAEAVQRRKKKYTYLFKVKRHYIQTIIISILSSIVKIFFCLRMIITYYKTGDFTATIFNNGLIEILFLS